MPKQRAVWYWGTCCLVMLACSEKGDVDGSGANGGMSGSGGSTGSLAGAHNVSANAGSGSGAGAPSGGASAVGGGGAASGASVGGTSGGSASGGAPACPGADGLKVTRLDTTAIAMMGKPYDSDSDKTSPWGWDTNYGKRPEIVAVPDGDSLDILWQDHSADVSGNQTDPSKNAKKAFVVRVEKSAAGYAVTRAYQIDQLAHIMGLAKDEI